MKKYLIILLIIISISACKNDKKVYRDTVEIPNSIPFHFTTQKGVIVDSVVSVPDHSLMAIDIGIGQMLDASKRKFPHWTKKRTFSNFRIIFIDPTGYHETRPPGGPLLTVGAGNHNNAYGTTLGIDYDGWNDGQVLVLPHQANSNWAFDELLTNISRYESEHDAEWNNDRIVFWYYWNNGDIHPHY